MMLVIAMAVVDSIKFIQFCPWFFFVFENLNICIHITFQGFSLFNCKILVAIYTLSFSFCMLCLLSKDL